MRNLKFLCAAACQLTGLGAAANTILDNLRQPMEDGKLTISRAAGKITYPCKFMLVAAMNPCKCGYLGHPTRECTCTPSAIEQYRRRISGPLLDRIDLHVEALPVEYEDLAAESGGTAVFGAGPVFTVCARLPLRSGTPLSPPEAEDLLRDRYALPYVYLGEWCALPWM